MAERLLARFGPSTLTPKQGLECIYSLNRETRQKFYKTKVVWKACFSGGGSYFWKDLGPMCFCSHGQSFPGKVSKMKVVEHLPIEKWVRF